MLNEMKVFIHSKSLILLVDKYFHPTPYVGLNYFYVVELKLNYGSKGAPAKLVMDTDSQHRGGHYEKSFWTILFWPHTLISTLIRERLRVFFCFYP